MTSGSTGEKIKEKVKETIGAGEDTGQGIKEKVKETIGMGSEDKLRQPNKKSGRTRKGFRKGRRRGVKKTE